MLRCAAATALALALLGCQSTSSPSMTPMEIAAQDGWHHYGFEGRESGPALALGAISGGEANVIVNGTITEVCPKKGCWMNVQNGDDEVFVRFQDYAFFVPMNAAGRDVVMHGTAVAETASVEELRHYAQDAGKSAEEIAMITEPETRVTFFADSVFIAGDGLDAPFDQQ